MNYTKLYDMMDCIGYVCVTVGGIIVVSVGVSAIVHLIVA